MIVSLIALVAVLFGCALFAGMETGLYSLERVRLQVRAEGGDPRARWLTPLIAKPTRAVCSLLLATNVSHYFLAVVAARVIESFVHNSDVYTQKLVDTVVLAPVLFVCGDLLPKNVFLREPGRLMLIFQPLLRVTTWLFWPIVAPLVWLVERTNRKSPGHMGSAEFFDRGSIHFMLTVDDEAAQLTLPQRELAERVLRLRSVRVRDRMVPIAQASAVSLDATAQEVLETGARTRHSRLLVRSPDGVGFIGYVNVIDAASAVEGFRVETALHSLPVLDVELPITVALYRLQRSGRPIAAVSAGPGRSIIGLIAAYDVVEALFAVADRRKDRGPRTGESRVAGGQVPRRH